jgi:hypothetical protein
MKKRSITVCGLLTSAVALVLCCGSPQNPFTNPKSAVIVPDSSLTSLKKDSVAEFTAVPCTVSVYLPDLIDSFFVTRSIGSQADTTIASGKVTASKFAFSLPVEYPGAYTVSVRIVKIDKTQDSLTRTFTVYSLAPLVSPDSAAYHIILPQDSFTVKFTATDPDSNLRFGYIWIDTAIGQTQTTPFLTLKPFRGSFSWTVKSAGLLTALNRPIVFHAYAIDSDSLFSAVASCTLHVDDTTKPSIQLLAPKTTDTIRALPVLVMAVISDLDGINSVTFNGSSMTFMHGGDTAVDTVSSIDSGTAVDSIVAVDNGGNRSILRFSLTYQGKKLYPPQIKDLSRATAEGRPFPPLFLDTCIIITDTTIVNKAEFAKDSVRWEIRDSSGQLLNYDLNTHLFTVPFPADSAFFGTIKLTFKVIVTNTPTLYDTKQPSFFVTQANFPPVITLASDQCFKVLKTDTIYLDTITTAHDPNDALSSLNWSFSKGSHFKVDSVYTSRLLAKVSESAGIPIGNPIIPIFLFTRRIVIDAISAADTSFYGTDSLTFTVKDPGGLVASKKIYFTRPIGFCLFHL